MLSFGCKQDNSRFILIMIAMIRILLVDILHLMSFSTYASAQKVTFCFLKTDLRERPFLAIG